MARAKTPKMQIRQSIPINLDHGPHAIGHPTIGVHIEQDRTGVTHEAIGPSSDNDGPAQARDRVHPGPPQETSEQ
jgi:hypothetical protein